MRDEFQKLNNTKYDAININNNDTELPDPDLQYQTVTMNDYKGALRGLVFLHDTYTFNITATMKGRMGKRTHLRQKN